MVFTKLRDKERQIIKSLATGPKTYTEIKDQIKISDYSLSENIKRLVSFSVVSFNYADKRYALAATPQNRISGTQKMLANQVSAAFLHGTIIKTLNDEKRNELLEKYIKTFSYLVLTDIWAEIMDDPNPAKINEFCDNWLTPLLMGMAYTVHLNKDHKAVSETLLSLENTCGAMASEYDEKMVPFL